MSLVFPPDKDTDRFNDWMQELWKLVTKPVSGITETNHAALGNLNSTAYTHLTGANATSLTNGSDTTLHFHATDRNRANHTGTQASSTISDFTTSAQSALSAASSQSYANGANSKVVNNVLLIKDTTNATITELTTDGAAGSAATNRIVVPTNSAMSVVVNVCVKQSASANSKQMLRQFLITNTAGTVTIEGAVTVLGTDVGSVALVTSAVTITANNTDKCIKVEGTGVAAVNLRWTAYLVSTETKYA